MNEKTKGKISIGVSALLYGSVGVFSRIINFQIPLYYQQWIRNLLAVIFFGILLLITKNWKKIQKNDLPWFLARSVCGFISFVTIYIAFNYIPFSTNYFVSYAAATIGSFVIGRSLFGEKINPIKWVSLVLAIVGLYFVYTFTFEPGKFVYICMSFIGGVATAGWDTLSKKISGIYSNLQLNFFDFSFAAIIPLIISIIIKEPWPMISFTTPWIATFFFCFMYIITGILMVYGFKRVEAQIGSLILLFDIVIGIILGCLIFKESISFMAIIGGSLILVAIILPNLQVLKEAKK